MIFKKSPGEKRSPFIKYKINTNLYVRFACSSVLYRLCSTVSAMYLLLDHFIVPIYIMMYIFFYLKITLLKNYKQALYKSFRNKTCGLTFAPFLNFFFFRVSHVVFNEYSNSGEIRFGRTDLFRMLQAFKAVYYPPCNIPALKPLEN